MKKKIWPFFVVLLLILCGLIAFFWDTVLGFIAPKLILGSALKNLSIQIEEQLQNSPFLLLQNALDPEGNYTADVQIRAENTLLGEMSCNLKLKGDSVGHRVSADGVVNTSKRELDLSVYADDTFVALSSDSLLGGSYYGITYSTFAADIKEIPLVNLVINDQMIAKWDTSLRNLQARVAEIQLPHSPDIPPEKVKAALFAAVSLPCETERCSLLIDGRDVDCRKFRYQIAGDMLSLDPEAMFTASFYVKDKTIIRLVLQQQEGEQQSEYAIDFGSNPTSNPITIQGKTSKDGTTVANFRLLADTFPNGFEYCQLQLDDGYSVAAEWNSNEQKLKLTSRYQETANVIVKKTENGFQLQTDDLFGMMAILLGEPASERVTKTDCTADIRPGADVSTPGYKNLNQWSMGDFFTLLDGVGGLIGIGLE